MVIRSNILNRKIQSRKGSHSQYNPYWVELKNRPQKWWYFVLVALCFLFPKTQFSITDDRITINFLNKKTSKRNSETSFLLNSNTNHTKQTTKVNDFIDVYANNITKEKTFTPSKLNFEMLPILPAWTEVKGYQNKFKEIEKSDDISKLPIFQKITVNLDELIKTVEPVKFSLKNNNRKWTYQRFITFYSPYSMTSNAFQNESLINDALISFKRNLIYGHTINKNQISERLSLDNIDLKNVNAIEILIKWDNVTYKFAPNSNIHSNIKQIIDQIQTCEQLLNSRINLQNGIQKELTGKNLDHSITELKAVGTDLNFEQWNLICQFLNFLINTILFKEESIEYIENPLFLPFEKKEDEKKEEKEKKNEKEEEEEEEEEVKIILTPKALQTKTITDDGVAKLVDRPLAIINEIKRRQKLANLKTTNYEKSFVSLKDTKKENIFTPNPNPYALPIFIGHSAKQIFRPFRMVTNPFDLPIIDSQLRPLYPYFLNQIYHIPKIHRIADDKYNDFGIESKLEPFKNFKIQPKYIENKVLRTIGGFCYRQIARTITNSPRWTYQGYIKGRALSNHLTYFGSRGRVRKFHEIPLEGRAKTYRQILQFQDNISPFSLKNRNFGNLMYNNVPLSKKAIKLDSYGLHELIQQIAFNLAVLDDSNDDINDIDTINNLSKNEKLLVAYRKVVDKMLSLLIQTVLPSIDLDQTTTTKYNTYLSPDSVADFNLTLIDIIKTNLELFKDLDGYSSYIQDKITIDTKIKTSNESKYDIFHESQILRNPVDLNVKFEKIEKNTYDTQALVEEALSVLKRKADVTVGKNKSLFSENSSNKLDDPKKQFKTTLFPKFFYKVKDVVVMKPNVYGMNQELTFKSNEGDFLIQFGDYTKESKKYFEIIKYLINQKHNIDVSSFHKLIQFIDRPENQLNEQTIIEFWNSFAEERDKQLDLAVDRIKNTQDFVEKIYNEITTDSEQLENEILSLFKSDQLTEFDLSLIKKYEEELKEEKYELNFIEIKKLLESKQTSLLDLYNNEIFSIAKVADPDQIKILERDPKLPLEMKSEFLDKAHNIAISGNKNKLLYPLLKKYIFTIETLKKVHQKLQHLLHEGNLLNNDLEKIKLHSITQKRFDEYILSKLTKFYSLEKYIQFLKQYNHTQKTWGLSRNHEYFRNMQLRNEFYNISNNQIINPVGPLNLRLSLKENKNRDLTSGIPHLSHLFRSADSRKTVRARTKRRLAEIVTEKLTNSPEGTSTFDLECQLKLNKDRMSYPSRIKSKVLNDLKTIEKNFKKEHRAELYEKNKNPIKFADNNDYYKKLGTAKKEKFTNKTKGIKISNLVDYEIYRKDSNWNILPKHRKKTKRYFDHYDKLALIEPAILDKYKIDPSIFKDLEPGLLMTIIKLIRMQRGGDDSLYAISKNENRDNEDYLLKMLGDVTGLESDGSGGSIRRNTPFLGHKFNVKLDYQPSKDTTQTRRKLLKGIHSSSNSPKFEKKYDLGKEKRTPSVKTLQKVIDVQNATNKNRNSRVYADTETFYRPVDFIKKRLNLQLEDEYYDRQMRYITDKFRQSSRTQFGELNDEITNMRPDPIRFSENWSNENQSFNIQKSTDWTNHRIEKNFSRLRSGVKNIKNLLNIRKRLLLESHQNNILLPGLRSYKLKGVLEKQFYKVNKGTKLNEVKKLNVTLRLLGSKTLSFSSIGNVQFEQNIIQVLTKGMEGDINSQSTKNRPKLNLKTKNDYRKQQNGWFSLIKESLSLMNPLIKISVIDSFSKLINNTPLWSKIFDPENELNLKKEPSYLSRLSYKPFPKISMQALELDSETRGFVENENVDEKIFRDIFGENDIEIKLPNEFNPTHPLFPYLFSEKFQNPREVEIGRQVRELYRKTLEGTKEDKGKEEKEEKNSNKSKPSPTPSPQKNLNEDIPNLKLVRDMLKNPFPTGNPIPIRQLGEIPTDTDKLAAILATSKAKFQDLINHPTSRLPISAIASLYNEAHAKLKEQEELKKKFDLESEKMYKRTLDRYTESSVESDDNDNNEDNADVEKTTKPSLPLIKPSKSILEESRLLDLATTINDIKLVENVTVKPKRPKERSVTDEINSYLPFNQTKGINTDETFDISANEVNFVKNEMLIPNLTTVSFDDEPEYKAFLLTLKRILNEGNQPPSQANINKFIEKIKIEEWKDRLKRIIPEIENYSQENSQESDFAENTGDDIELASISESTSSVESDLDDDMYGDNRENKYDKKVKLLKRAESYGHALADQKYYEYLEKGSDSDDSLSIPSTLASDDESIIDELNNYENLDNFVDYSDEEYSNEGYSDEELSEEEDMVFLEVFHPDIYADYQELLREAEFFQGEITSDSLFADEFSGFVGEEIDSEESSDKSSSKQDSKESYTDEEYTDEEYSDEEYSDQDYLDSEYLDQDYSDEGSLDQDYLESEYQAGYNSSDFDNFDNCSEDSRSKSDSDSDSDRNSVKRRMAELNLEEWELEKWDRLPNLIKLFTTIRKTRNLREKATNLLLNQLFTEIETEPLFLKSDSSHSSIPLESQQLFQVLNSRYLNPSNNVKRYQSQFLHPSYDYRLQLATLSNKSYTHINDDKLEFDFSLEPTILSSILNNNIPFFPSILHQIRLIANKSTKKNLEDKNSREFSPDIGSGILDYQQSLILGSITDNINLYNPDLKKRQEKLLINLHIQNEQVQSYVVLFNNIKRIFDKNQDDQFHTDFKHRVALRLQSYYSHELHQDIIKIANSLNNSIRKSKRQSQIQNKLFISDLSLRRLQQLFHVFSKIGHRKMEFTSKHLQKFKRKEVQSLWTDGAVMQVIQTNLIRQIEKEIFGQAISKEIATYYRKVLQSPFRRGFTQKELAQSARSGGLSHVFPLKFKDLVMKCRQEGRRPVGARAAFSNIPGVGFAPIDLPEQIEDKYGDFLMDFLDSVKFNTKLRDVDEDIQNIEIDPHLYYRDFSRFEYKIKDLRAKNILVDLLIKSFEEDILDIGSDIDDYATKKLFKIISGKPWYFGNCARNITRKYKAVERFARLYNFAIITPDVVALHTATQDLKKGHTDPFINLLKQYNINHKTVLSTRRKRKHNVSQLKFLNPWFKINIQQNKYKAQLGLLIRAIQQKNWHENRDGFILGDLNLLNQIQLNKSKNNFKNKQRRQFKQDNILKFSQILTRTDHSNWPYWTLNKITNSQREAFLHTQAFESSSLRRNELLKDFVFDDTNYPPLLADKDKFKNYLWPAFQDMSQYAGPEQDSNWYSYFDFIANAPVFEETDIPKYEMPDFLETKNIIDSYRKYIDIINSKNISKSLSQQIKQKISTKNGLKHFINDPEQREFIRNFKLKGENFPRTFTELHIAKENHFDDLFANDILPYRVYTRLILENPDNFKLGDTPNYGLSFGGSPTRIFYSLHAPRLFDKYEKTETYISGQFPGIWASPQLRFWERTEDTVPQPDFDQIDDEELEDEYILGNDENLRDVLDNIISPGGEGYVFDPNYYSSIINGLENVECEPNEKIDEDIEGDFEPDEETDENTDDFLESDEYDEIEMDGTLYQEEFMEDGAQTGNRRRVSKKSTRKKKKPILIPKQSRRERLKEMKRCEREGIVYKRPPAPLPIPLPLEVRRKIEQQYKLRNKPVYIDHIRLRNKRRPFGSPAIIRAEQPKIQKKVEQSDSKKMRIDSTLSNKPKILNLKLSKMFRENLMKFSSYYTGDELITKSLLALIEDHAKKTGKPVKKNYKKSASFSKTDLNNKYVRQLLRKKYKAKSKGESPEPVENYHLRLYSWLSKYMYISNPFRTDSFINDYLLSQIPAFQGDYLDYLPETCEQIRPFKKFNLAEKLAYKTSSQNFVQNYIIDSPKARNAKFLSMERPRFGRSVQIIWPENSLTQQLIFSLYSTYILYVIYVGVESFLKRPLFKKVKGQTRDNRRFGFISPPLSAKNLYKINLYLDSWIQKREQLIGYRFTRTPNNLLTNKRSQDKYLVNKHLKAIRSIFHKQETLLKFSHNPISWVESSFALNQFAVLALGSPQYGQIWAKTLFLSENISCVFFEIYSSLFYNYQKVEYLENNNNGSFTVLPRTLYTKQEKQRPTRLLKGVMDLRFGISTLFTSPVQKVKLKNNRAILGRYKKGYTTNLIFPHNILKRCINIARNISPCFIVLNGFDRAVLAQRSSKDGEFWMGGVFGEFGKLPILSSYSLTQLFQDEIISCLSDTIKCIEPNSSYKLCLIVPDSTRLDYRLLLRKRFCFQYILDDTLNLSKSDMQICQNGEILNPRFQGNYFLSNFTDKTVINLNIPTVRTLSRFSESSKIISDGLYDGILIKKIDTREYLNRYIFPLVYTYMTSYSSNEAFLRLATPMARNLIFTHFFKEWRNVLKKQTYTEIVWKQNYTIREVLIPVIFTYLHTVSLTRYFTSAEQRKLFIHFYINVCFYNHIITILSELNNNM